MGFRIVMPYLREEINKCADKYKLSYGFLLSVFFAPIIVMSFFTVLLASSETRPWARWMLGESHPVELLQFLIALLILACAIRLFINARKNQDSATVQALLLFFVLGTFFVAMEEISWGQWFFRFETPEAIKSVNRQKEMNIHNLPGVHSFFEVCRALYGFLGLLALKIPERSRFRQLAPPIVLSSWFLIIGVLAALDVPNYYWHRRNIFFIAVSQLVEVLELLIYASLFLYIWFYERVSKAHNAVRI